MTEVAAHELISINNIKQKLQQICVSETPLLIDKIKKKKNSYLMVSPAINIISQELGLLGEINKSGNARKFRAKCLPIQQSKNE